MDWKSPVSISDLSKEYSRENIVKDRKKRIILGWILNFSRYPTTVMIFIIFKLPNIIGLLVILLTIPITIISRTTVFNLHSIINSFDLFFYLKKDIKGKFLIKRKKIEEYIDTSILSRIKVLRVLSPMNYAPLGEICILTPINNELIMPSQMKGFVIPFSLQGSIHDNPLISNSKIFITDEPEDVSILEKWKILHEIGHMTSYSWKNQLKPYEGIINIISMFVLFCILESFNLNSISIIFLVPAFLYWIYDFFNSNRRSLNDEEIADTFAIKSYQSNQDRFEILSFMERTNFLTKKRISKMNINHTIMESGNTPLEGDYIYHSKTYRLFFVLCLFIGILLTSSTSINILLYLVIWLIIGLIFLLFTMFILRWITSKIDNLITTMEHKKHIA